MRFGAHYLNTYVPELDGSPAELYRHLFAQIDELDALGYDDVWVTEHHFDEYGGLISDPPVFLAAAARTTRHIHFGIAVSVLPLHNPIQVAESYAMVDVVSNGRLEFGVGRGSTSGEFASFGIPQDDSAPRMKEATEIIRQAWSGDPVEFHGDVFTYDGVRVLPRPVQQPHPPIWVGASRSDDTFRWAGHHGYHVMTLPYMYEPDVLHHWLGIYRDALVEAGHDPAAREVLGKFHIYVADSLEQARDEAIPYLRRYRDIANARNNTRSDKALPNDYADEFDDQVRRGNLIAGDPQGCIDIINRWRDTLGLTTISGTFHFGGMPHDLALKNIRLFAEQVMPAFERSRNAVGVG
jgi:natural product biosynthesis luciferase-like monooxygenase protein